MRYALDLDTLRTFKGNDVVQREVQLRQRFDSRDAHRRGDAPLYRAETHASFAAADRIASNISGLGPYVHSGQNSRKSYAFGDSLGDCYSATLTTRDGRVVSHSHGDGCLDPAGTLHWFVHPDGAPNGFGW